jgi:hypothetical protein
VGGCELQSQCRCARSWCVWVSVGVGRSLVYSVPGRLRIGDAQPDDAAAQQPESHRQMFRELLLLTGAGDSLLTLSGAGRHDDRRRSVVCRELGGCGRG